MNNSSYARYCIDPVIFAKQKGTAYAAPFLLVEEVAYSQFLRKRKARVYNRS